MSEPEYPIVHLDFKALCSEFTDGYDFNDCAESVAKERGLVVYYRNQNEILLDLDSEQMLQEAMSRFRVMFDQERGWYSYCYPSASGAPHYHCIIRGPHPFSDAAACAFQSVLGSDPMREFLTMQRIMRKVDNPIRLFEPAERLVSIHYFFNSRPICKHRTHPLASSLNKS
jgi:hypothetical protein